MGLANAIVRNYSSLALVVAGSSFGYGLLYAVTHNSSPLADAKASLGEMSRPHPLSGQLCVAVSASKQSRTQRGSCSSCAPVVGGTPVWHRFAGPCVILAADAVVNLSKHLQARAVDSSPA